MPFPSKAGGAPARTLDKKGKSKTRRLGVAWTYRAEPSNDDTTLYRTEVKSTNVGSAITSLLKVLNDGLERSDKEFLKKSDIVVVEVKLLARGEEYADTEE